MKIIKSKGLAQKIILAITLIVLLFNVILPTNSFAISFDIGGTLWTPVQALVCGLGDVFFDFLQHTFIADAPDAVIKLIPSQVIEGEHWYDGLAKIFYKVDFLAGLDAGIKNFFGMGDR